MREKEAGLHIISTLDDIAWLLNLRGSDVDCNPVFVAYCLVEHESVTLYTDPQKLTEELKTTLAKDKVRIEPYSEAANRLKDIKDEKILIDRSTINAQLHDILKPEAIIAGPLITRHLKAIKNETEISHFKAVHKKDAVALTHAFYWLEKAVLKSPVSEYTFAKKLEECRRLQPHYFGESFSAIVGYKGNGAIIHYRPDKDDSAMIENDGILLVDSGGQYMDGTTDITRTISFTPPPPEQKNSYTRVLKGHIALAMAVFPEGTSGGQLDALARHSLWADGLNYGHGTGHGVGFFLNVHEPPQGFAPGTSGRAASVQKPGMVTSNEPGHYVADAYGIRIENLVLTIKSDKAGLLAFETITYFPIDTTLIERSLLSQEEVSWLNDYHADVHDKIVPMLKEPYKAWMVEKCKPI